MTAEEGGFASANHLTSTHVQEKVETFIHESVADCNVVQHQLNNITEQNCALQDQTVQMQQQMNMVNIHQKQPPPVTPPSTYVQPPPQQYQMQPPYFDNHTPPEVYAMVHTHNTMIPPTPLTLPPNIQQ